MGSQRQALPAVAGVAVQAASGSIAILERRPLGLLLSATGFHLRRPTLFVQFLIVISPMEVLS